MFDQFEEENTSDDNGVSHTPAAIEWGRSLVLFLLFFFFVWPKQSHLDFGLRIWSLQKSAKLVFRVGANHGLGSTAV